MTKQKQFEEKIVSFLHELGRDHIPLGDIEKLTKNSEHEVVTKYTNKQLEVYAREIMKRLKGN